ncbi:glycine cleavage system protein GcvH [Acuticoccus yangtzensis]|uniref:glycine cleavage system protein GcvH n=1 Tax=Acuticoccus yangtzensis TaxID=1443441 RepID=UPI0009498242|nr:glycine cleavage system protein GcvH [Acuticoccus yangtzensis]ORE95329.1 glycine cleavage system protein H [Stappia sp. 22II-S9-Z10]
MKRYTKDHEWIEDADGILTVGITDHAQEQLGDITFVELPEVGKTVAKGDAFAVVESVKAASDVYAPVAGEVVEVNETLDATPELVNEAPEAAGWFAKIKTASADLSEFMDQAGYDEYLKTIS